MGAVDDQNLGAGHLVVGEGGLDVPGVGLPAVLLPGQADAAALGGAQRRGEGTDHEGRHHRSGREVATDGLHESDRFGKTHAEAVVVLGDQQSGPALVDEVVPQCSIPHLVGVAQSTGPADRRLLRQQLARRIEEQALVLIEDQQATRALSWIRAHLGILRTVRARMLRWTSLEPPSMVFPRDRSHCLANARSRSE